MAPCHWTAYTVPLYPLHRTIVPSTSYHCTPYIVPLYPLHRTVAPHLSYLLYREIAPATWYHCARYIVPLHPYTSYHCTPYVAPLYLSYCTSCTWCTCATVPLRCLHCTIAPALRTPVPALYTPWKSSSHLPPDYLSEQCFWNLFYRGWGNGIPNSILLRKPHAFHAQKGHTHRRQFELHWVPRGPNLPRDGHVGKSLAPAFWTTTYFRLKKSHLIEGSLEVKLPTIWTDEKQSRAEAERRERLEERRVEEKESEERRCRCAKR